METFNEKQKLAYEKINGGEDVLIFGPGGSGKSYLIDVLRKDNERMLCLAPTGMAAINMNEEARTIHSLLMIGAKSLQAWNWEKVSAQIGKQKVKIKNLLDNYDTIVFDEGSMIISGLFQTLKRTFQMIYNTDDNKPFGDKQTIMLLDPLQLPPVKNSSEPYLDLDKRNYEARELIQTDYIVNDPTFKRLFNKDKGNIIQFTQNLRCKNQRWIHIREACRTGFHECPQDQKREMLRELNEHRICQVDCLETNEETQNLSNEDRLFDSLDTYESGVDKDHIARKYKQNTQTTLKKQTVEQRNNARIVELVKLGETQYNVSRKVQITEKEFIKTKSGGKQELRKLYEHSRNYMDDLGGYYALKNEDKTFHLDMSVVVGERVMLRRNGIHPKLKNGSLGIITQINLNERVEVQSINVLFDTLEESIEIKEILFEHPEITEMKIKAFPLIPAFAITIHKLQGQTIDSPLFINYNDIPFKEKQNHLLYTAISRCKNPNDVYIISDKPITEGHFPVDPIMYEWYVQHKN